MIPILYSAITEGTVPDHYGVGPLTAALSCLVTEERNGAYELELTYPASGIHAEEIKPNAFIKAKPNFMDAPQIFRINKVGKTIAGKFTVRAYHITYDLSGKVIQSGSAGSCATACALLTTSAGNFTISTNKAVAGSFEVVEPSSVRSWLGGKEGSLLDVYGSGEWKFDNYTARLMTSRGADRGVTIRYGKNLTQLSQEIDMSNLVTAIVPYYIDQNGNKTVGASVPTGLTLDVPRDLAVDFSQSVQPENGTPVLTQLANLAAAYIANNNLTTLGNSITLDFVQSGAITERVDLCDTVGIYVEALGITARAKCVKTIWDVLQDRYSKITLGQVRTNIADTIASNKKELTQTATRADVNRATELITGNRGGYVVMRDSDGDGEPDEFLIMNTPDIHTATRVWRWNQAGLGYSDNGYEGPYGLAMTSEGEIDADFIKVGVISDAQGNSTIDMTNGEAILNELKAKRILTLVDANGINRGHLSYTISTGAAMMLREPSGQATVSVVAGTSNDASVLLMRSNGTMGVEICSDGILGGRAAFYDLNNKPRVRIDPNTGVQVNNTSRTVVLIGQAVDNGGSVGIYNSSGTQVGSFMSISSAGYISVSNSSGTQTIYGDGSNGSLTCGSLHQTSSKKVKKNIKPIQDAAKILELQAVSFDYKEEQQGKDRRGFIAEDVQPVLPNLVAPEEDGRPASLDYVGMIPYLQDVLKSQQQEITELKKRIEALENKINAQEGKNDGNV